MAKMAQMMEMGFSILISRMVLKEPPSGRGSGKGWTRIWQMMPWMEESELLDNIAVRLG